MAERKKVTVFSSFEINFVTRWKQVSNSHPNKKVVLSSCSGKASKEARPKFHLNLRNSVTKNSCLCLSLVAFFYFSYVRAPKLRVLELSFSGLSGLNY